MPLYKEESLTFYRFRHQSVNTNLGDSDVKDKHIWKAGASKTETMSHVDDEEDFVDDEYGVTRVYNMNRRKKKLVSSQRSGPVLLDDDTLNSITSETLGKLAAVSQTILEQDGEENNLAGSQELQSYFLRLSLPGTENEVGLFLDLHF